MSPLLRNLALALVLALIAWLGYVVFLKDDEEVVSTANSGVINEAVRDGQEFLMRLQQMRSIELEGAVLNDPRFKSLIDLRQDLVAEPVGRDNPFLPIGTSESGE